MNISTSRTQASAMLEMRVRPGIDATANSKVTVLVATFDEQPTCSRAESRASLVRPTEQLNRMS